MQKLILRSAAFLIVAVLENTVCLAQSDEQRSVENQMLATARQNIERHRKGDVVIRIRNKGGKPLAGVSVEVNQVSQDFLFGGLSEEIFRPGIDSAYAAEFRRLFKDLFNFTILTFKWAPYEPEQGKIQWQKHESALAWYRENNITVKGHTLGWTHHAGTPSWIYKLTPEVATELYRARIYNIVAGYRSRINIWDVVNEPVTTIPWEHALQDTVKGNGEIDAGVRYDVKDVSIEQTLPWVEKSYRWAQEANEDGHYILNEFYVIAKPDVRDKFYNLLKELQKRNVPVKGIGIQAHEPRDMWFSPVEFYKTLDLYATLNLPIHITEFIPQSSGKEITGWRTGKWTEKAQADFAEQFYTLAFGHPSVASFNWWGFSDKYIWLNAGGVIDSNNNPKEVYTRLKKLIREDWMTKKLSVKSNKMGLATFRGFYGKYDVTITRRDGSRELRSVHVREHGENVFEFHL